MEHFYEAVEFYTLVALLLPCAHPVLCINFQKMVKTSNNDVLIFQTYIRQDCLLPFIPL